MPLLSFCSAPRTHGGVILLSGVGLDVLPLPQSAGIKHIPRGPDSLAHAVELASEGQQVALDVPNSDQVHVSKTLRQAQLPHVSTFVYRAPGQLVAEAAGASQALDLLEAFYAQLKGTSNRKAAHVGSLRRADLQRAIAKVRHTVPKGSAEAARCDKVERDLTSALVRLVFCTPSSVASSLNHLSFIPYLPLLPTHPPTLPSSLPPCLPTSLRESTRLWCCGMLYMLQPLVPDSHSV